MQFRTFILENQDIEHHLVTFRSKEQAKYAYYELELAGLVPENFTSMSWCPDYLYHAFKMNEDDKHPLAIEFREWKGYIASLKQCTLLVDDLPHMVIAGCDKYNIEFLNAFTVFT
ncbi:MAG: hypothetical protein P4L79_11040 [Legionella sp.]|uniref:hypothetical protein n=1 Tax=Legionella sp. TaxID=459 RepID=UPI00283C8CA8|nr:hypothetical protein [Legionella sp.]